MKTTLFTALLLCSAIFAQQSTDARSAGMAFSDVANARGLQAIGMNPASLALPTRYNFEMNLLSASVGAANNSFDRSYYDRYFTSGGFLDNTAKNTLLNAIPAAGLEGDVSLRMNTLSFYAPRFALALTGMGDGNFVLPKEVAELALYGNQDPGKKYDFSSLDGGGWGGVALNVSMGFPLNMSNNKHFSFMSIGFTGKYFGGVGYMNVQEASGAFQNASLESPVMSLQGQAELLSARGGSGFGLDLGVLAQSHGKWSYSFSAANILGSINWDNQPEIRRYTILSDSLTLSADGIADSLLVEEDTTFAVSAFSTRLPLVLDFGSAFQASKSWLITGQISQGFGGDLFNSGFRLALGSEFSWLSFLPLRAGFQLGGKDSYSVAYGLGLNLRVFYLDLGLVNHGGVLPGQARGLTVSASSRLRL